MDTKNYNKATKFFRDMELVDPYHDRWGKFADAMDEVISTCVPVVRCKDCKHGSLYCTEDICGATLIECNHPDLGETVVIHKWNWFCADGAKRSD